MPDDQITATVTPQEKEAVRLAAFKARIPLRKWVGEAIREKLARFQKPKKTKA